MLEATITQLYHYYCYYCALFSVPIRECSPISKLNIAMSRVTPLQPPSLSSRLEKLLRQQFDWKMGSSECGLRRRTSNWFMVALSWLAARARPNQLEWELLISDRCSGFNATSDRTWFPLFGAGIQVMRIKFPEAECRQRANKKLLPHLEKLKARVVYPSYSFNSSFALNKLLWWKKERQHGTDDYIIGNLRLRQTEIPWFTRPKSPVRYQQLCSVSFLFNKIQHWLLNV